MRARLAAWWVTGPLGHLVAGAADWGQLLARHWRKRLKPADEGTIKPD
jgi:hypothetical protein